MRPAALQPRHARQRVDQAPQIAAPAAVGQLGRLAAAQRAQVFRQFVGIGQAAFSVMQATIVFVAAPVERRMQAMGVLTMCIGVGPVGFLMLGWLAERLGASSAAVISAVTGLAILAASWRWWRACWRDSDA